MFNRLFLVVALIPLQSCSNTQIGEKLEMSFDLNENPKNSEITTEIQEQKKLKQIKKIKLSKIDDKENENIKGNIAKENLISNKERFSQKTNKSIKKVIFNPQPYRIILKLSGANPSAPAETVTNALRKAGVQFEVEKIERFDEESLLKDSSMKRK
tara:strand:- start:3 stop:470 length:468 start_codon:yes stop_codon:yes gene_type:complete